MRLSKLLPVSLGEGDLNKFLVSLVKNSFVQIDELESEITRLQNRLDYYFRFYQILLRQAEHNAEGPWITFRSLFDESDDFDLVKEAITDNELHTDNQG